MICLAQQGQTKLASFFFEVLTGEMRIPIWIIFTTDSSKLVMEGAQHQVYDRPWKVRRVQKREGRVHEHQQYIQEKKTPVTHTKRRRKETLKVQISVPVPKACHWPSDGKTPRSPFRMQPLSSESRPIDDSRDLDHLCCTSRIPSSPINAIWGDDICQWAACATINEGF